MTGWMDEDMFQLRNEGRHTGAKLVQGHTSTSSSSSMYSRASSRPSMMGGLRGTILSAPALHHTNALRTLCTLKGQGQGSHRDVLLTQGSTRMSKPAFPAGPDFALHGPRPEGQAEIRTRASLQAWCQICQRTQQTHKYVNNIPKKMLT